MSTYEPVGAWRGSSPDSSDGIFTPTTSEAAQYPRHLDAKGEKRPKKDSSSATSLYSILMAGMVFTIAVLLSLLARGNTSGTTYEFGFELRRNSSCPILHIPTPGNTYRIIESRTGEPLTVNAGRLSIQASGHQDGDDRWLMTNVYGYYALMNAKYGVYIGHDGSEGIRVSATTAGAWETMTLREVGDGSHLIMMPHWTQLYVLDLASDGVSLLRKPTGNTSWRFVRA